MPKPKTNSRRLIISIGLVLVLALVGLATINTAPVTAGQSLSNNLTQAGSTSEAGATTGDKESTRGGVSPVASMSAAGSIFKMVSALVVVVICIYGAVFALKKLMGRKATGRGSMGLLEVLETAHLGPKKAVSIVRIANRSVLVGVTDNQITLLSELDEAQTEQMTAADDEEVSVSSSFGDMLKSATAKIKELSSGKPEAALADK